MSRRGLLESQCFAQLQTIASFAETKAVASGTLLTIRPDAYPAAFIALMDTIKVGEDQQIGNNVTRMRKVVFGCLILASSDGIQIGDGRTSAWTLADDVEDAFGDFVPNLSGEATTWPVETGDAQNVLTDTGQSAIYIPLTCQIQWTI